MLDIPNESLKQAVHRLLFDRNRRFYASIIYQQEFVETHRIDTACVNGTQFFYNPDYVESLSNDERETLVAHEVHHLLGLHHTRMKDREIELWNEATDHIINHQLNREGFTVPNNWLMDDEFADSAAEDVYCTLKNRKSEDPDGDDEGNEDQQKKSDGDGDGSAQGSSQDQSDKDDTKDDSDNENGSDGQDSKSGDGSDDQSGDSGSGSNDESDESDNDDGDSSQSDSDKACDEAKGKVGPAGVMKPSDDPVQNAKEEAKTKVQIQNAARQCQKAGTLPVGVERIINEACEHRTDWEEIVAQWFNEIANDDYTWMRPNARMFGATGMILPSLHNERLATLVMAQDTSISISFEMLSDCCNSLLELLALYEEQGADPELLVIYCDSAVAGFQRMKVGDKPKPKGGGGTRFSPVFRWIEDNEDEEPVALVYLTDGYCADFGPEPDYPVIWLLCVQNKSFNPPFGEVVYMYDTY